jgi:glycosyltransferase involved in cell wall biosynthesis
MIVDVIIPALNEERSIDQVVRAALATGHVRRVVVGDNGSTDRTAAIASQAGAMVVHAPRRGYGSACMAALDALRPDPPSAVLFMDGDAADDPADIPRLLAELAEADLVIGSRTRGAREPGALTPHARWGNWLACRLIAARWGVRFTDLGPLRMIRWQALEALQMSDPDWGWTVEMQIKAARQGLRCREIPVAYRRRIGVSKVSGTLSGSWNAGLTILRWIAVESRR